MEEEKFYTELKHLRCLLAKVLGTEDLPKKEQFSKDAIKKASIEFRKLQINRGEWINESDISKIFRSAPYGSGKFIIEKFDFKNYFIRGKQLYFNRKDLVALNKELKAKKINLKTYIELEKDKENFNKHIEQLRHGKMKRPRFKIPDELKDINSEPYNHPPKELILNHIEKLLIEYETHKLVEYIDIFHEDYAMFKFIYCFNRYLDAEKRKLCEKWCFEFNYAQTALKEIKKIKSQTIY